MRSLALALAILLAACAAGRTPPVHGITPGHQCDSSGASAYVGEAATSDVGAHILRTTHSAVLRWAPIGYMLTMDYREDRVTVRLGPDRRITAISCG